MLKAGDVLITDPRTLHRGTPNGTDTPRPFAVIVYNRYWYWSKIIERLEANERHLLRKVRRTAG